MRRRRCDFTCPSHPIDSLASRRETFEHGFLEAVCMLDRSRGRPVLLVVGDEAPPESLAALSDDPYVPYAVALRLARDGEGSAVELRLERSAAGATRPAWPSALAFVEWWLSSQSELRLEHPPREWVWSR